MNARSFTIGLTACLVATGAWAQDVYVSGIAHSPLGDAVFDPPVERRLPVRNLGSSGEDGVEIKYKTAHGGETAVDTSELFEASATGEIKIRHKGWDGTIKGAVRMASNGDGSAVLDADFAESGAVDIQCVAYDDAGQIVYAGTLPPGGIQCHLDPTCPPGQQLIWWFATVWDRNTHQWTYVLKWACLRVFSWDGSPWNARVVHLTPIYPPPGSSDGMESLLVTGANLTVLEVSDATLNTFDLPHYGLGSAKLEEECNDPAQCGYGHRRLPVRNIGSSGQDGADIQWPPAKRLADWEARLSGIDPAAAPAGSELRMTVKGMVGGAPDQVAGTMTMTYVGGPAEIALDFSPVQPASLTAEYYSNGTLVLVEPGLDPNGASALATPALETVISLHKCTWCTPPRWIAVDFGSNPLWPYRTIGGQLLIDIDHTVVTIGEPGIDVPDITGVEVTTNAASSFTLEAETFAGECNPCDMNCDGSVNGQDIGGFIAALSGTPAGCSPCAADTNGDGSINGFDVSGFIACLGQP